LIAFTRDYTSAEKWKTERVDASSKATLREGNANGYASPST